MKEVRVEICNQTYSLRGELDEAYVQRLAAYVDEKMRALAAHTETADSLRLAILAALNIADDYFCLRQQTDQRRHEATELPPEFTQRLTHCHQLLDAALAKHTP